MITSSNTSPYSFAFKTPEEGKKNQAATNIPTIILDESVRWVGPAGNKWDSLWNHVDHSHNNIAVHWWIHVETLG